MKHFNQLESRASFSDKSSPRQAYYRLYAVVQMERKTSEHIHNGFRIFKIEAWEVTRVKSLVQKVDMEKAKWHQYLMIKLSEPWMSPHQDLKQQ